MSGVDFTKPVDYSDLQLFVDSSQNCLHAHKFMVCKRSKYIKERVDAESTRANSGIAKVELQDLPGGLECLDKILQFIYAAIPPKIDDDGNGFAEVYAAAFLLQVDDLVEELKIRLQEILAFPQASLRVLQKASVYDLEALCNKYSMSGKLSCKPEDLEIVLIGRTINAVADNFSPSNEILELGPDFFSCIVRTARDRGVQYQEILQQTTIDYLRKWLASGRELSPEDFLQCITAPGPLQSQDDIVAQYYDIVKEYVRNRKNIRGKVFEGLEKINFWECLPPACVEEAYEMKDLFDRHYVASALFAQWQALRYQQNQRLLGTY